jgi:hypothetical protein
MAGALAFQVSKIIDKTHQINNKISQIFAGNTYYTQRQ